MSDSGCQMFGLSGTTSLSDRTRIEEEEKKKGLPEAVVAEVVCTMTDMDGPS